MSTESRHELLDVPANALSSFPELLTEIFEGRLLGAIVRGSFDPSELRRFKASLEAPSSPIAGARPPHYGGDEFGRALVVSADLERYFAEGVRLRQACQTLGFEFEARLVALLLTLASGLVVRAPVHTSGRPYGLATVRRLEPGGTIDLHCENETLGFPAMAHLRTVIDPATQLSFYAPLELPEAGGELFVYPVHHGRGVGVDLSRMDRKSAATLRVLDETRPVAARPGVGDLLLFDAGRHYHRVTKVEGATSRWTMGGFLARDPGHGVLYYWG
jgi:GNAT superfamily N-acetyltransferase